MFYSWPYFRSFDGHSNRVSPCSTFGITLPFENHFLMSVFCQLLPAVCPVVSLKSTIRKRILLTSIEFSVLNSCTSHHLHNNVMYFVTQCRSISKLNTKQTITLILLHEKFLQFDWLRAAVFQLNLKYLHVKITNVLWVVV